jgi:hypothetical protein
LGILGFLLGMIFPPGLIFIYTVFGVIVCFEFCLDYKRGVRVIQKWIVPLVGFVCISAPSLLYLFFMTSFYPWKRLAEFDVIHPLPFDYLEYAKALGPMLPLGGIGLILALWKKDKRMLPAASWVVAWALLLGIFRFIPSQSPLRFSEMVPHVGLGILATYGFVSFAALAKKYRGVKEVIQFVALVIPVGLIMLGMFHMYSSYLWQKDFVDHKIRASYPLVPTGSYVMYPLKDFVAAISYIAQTSPRDAIVLSESTAGNYIPVYGGNRVFIGHDNTVHAEDKKVEVKEFFSGHMSAARAQSFMATTGASVVFFGPQEKEDGGIGDFASVYPFLHKVYQNAYVTVYRAL